MLPELGLEVRQVGVAVPEYPGLGEVAGVDGGVVQGVAVDGVLAAGDEGGY